MADDYAGVGGSYTLDKKGELVLQERTKDADPAVTVTLGTIYMTAPEPAAPQSDPTPDAPPSE